ncbi:hypothetical protein [Tunicatimonas pelagia]|uniref:hypothetical protein n=1 Tax=Tunicatimonas pelagia TaxID=931531 RepID=UPI002664FA36|nr:hypothetical protein [Tunicatimonas pelagia]WKN43624.1 hypothetical protein P0M28_01405 [Tunicatimonas pelagia]
MRVFVGLGFGLTALLLMQQTSLVEPTLKIDVWYGTNQQFGQPGLTQQWVNVLGNVQPDTSLQTLRYSLNGGSHHTLSIGEDGRRLARNGDFNIDLHVDSLQEGENKLLITAIDSLGNQINETVNIQFTSANQWTLPYAVDWDTVQQIADVVQIVDGRWELVEGGVRTSEPYYDRVLAFGDTSWRDYEVTTSVIFHDFTLPRPGPPTFNVSHSAIATRWPGHDFDKNQPHTKWFPLGATAEFRLTDNLDSCRWRVFDGENLYVEDTSKIRSIELGVKYQMKHRVFTIHDSLTRYQVKLWGDGSAEPGDWDLVAEEFASDNIQSGSALLLAHNTDVTFGSFSVISINDE